MFQFEIGDPDEVELKEGCAGMNTQDHSIDSFGFEVGDRIKCDHHSGVVRYIGPVSPHQGIWLGIEWDEPSRGKHNGSVQGVEYFRPNKANAASFIRPDKAKRATNLITALHERYGHDEVVMNRLKQIDQRMEKMRITFNQLRILDLSSREISELGKPGELAEMCPRIEFLDLAENLITQWDSITELCVTLKNLKRLDLSANPLQQPVKDDTLFGRFEKMEHIILGRIKYDWMDIIAASEIWPYITNLQVPFNSISRLLPPINTLMNLTNLDLEGNQITSWDEVIKLNVCQRLEYINLCANRITCVRFPMNILEEPNSQTTELFPKLMRLNLSENFIENWGSITELNKLMGLRELRMDLNPFLEKDTRENNRQLIIARMGKLVKLEGIDITRQEKRDAEIDYVKKFSTKWSTEGTELRFAVEHPRYVELVKRWGETEAGEVATTVRTMQTSLITLQLIPQNPSVRSCSKKVMPNMSVQKLKMFLQRTFKVTASISDVKLVSSRNPNISFSLDNDFFDLSQYSVEDGDKLLITW